jgi:ketose-bisphosphate aldolase
MVMPSVSDGRVLIQRAFEGNYALPSFNVCSLEMAKACIEAAEEERAPIMLQTYPGDLEHASPKVMTSMIRALADEVSVPIMLHLDHGPDLETATRCLRAGYSSVMFDGEEFPLTENIRLTDQLASFAHAAGACLEAAAGSFGGGEGGDDEIHLTEPEDAARLYKEGHADMIAVSVGSKHGQSSQLDVDRLASIAKVVQGPLVLHGGTGIPASDLAEAVNYGVVKVNIGAGLQRAVMGVWKDKTADAAWHYDVYHAARDALREVAKDKIRITQAAGQAS